MEKLATGTPSSGEPMIDSSQLARAVHLTAKPIDVNTWRVRGGIADHMIEVVDGRCYCDCMDAQVRGPGCKHALLVRLLGGDPDVVKALRELIAAPESRSTGPQTSRPHPESPNWGGTGPDSHQTGPRVGSGATNAGHHGVQSR